jgi:hypothetical protein
MKTLLKMTLSQNCLFLFLCFSLYSVPSFTQGSRKANTDNIKRKWLDIAYATKSQAQKLEFVIGKEKVTLELLQNTGHGGLAFNTEQNINKIFVVLDKTLKEK